MGDALAMTLLVRKGFREEDFASLHPGGKLGKRLMRVEHVMHAGDAAPSSRVDTRWPTCIHEMSSKRLGMTCVVDDEGRLVGHLHRRRPAPADEPRRRTCSTLTRRRSDDAASRHDPRDAAGRRGAADDGDAQDHVGRRRRRRRRVEGVVHLHDLWRTQMI